MCRDRRCRPSLDDKVVVAWNGLAIQGLAYAGEVLGMREAFEAACRAATFIQTTMTAPGDDAALITSYRQGPAAINAFADDYACLIGGILAVHGVTGARRWLDWAERLQAKMDTLFWDPENGGYYDAHAAPDVVLRLKEGMLALPER